VVSVIVTDVITEIRQHLADEAGLNVRTKLRLLRKIEAALTGALPEECAVLNALRERILGQEGDAGSSTPAG